MNPTVGIVFGTVPSSRRYRIVDLPAPSNPSSRKRGRGTGVEARQFPEGEQGRTNRRHRKKKRNQNARVAQMGTASHPSLHGSSPMRTKRGRKTGTTTKAERKMGARGSTKRRRAAEGAHIISPSMSPADTTRVLTVLSVSLSVGPERRRTHTAPRSAGTSLSWNPVGTMRNPFFLVCRGTDSRVTKGGCQSDWHAAQ